MSYCCGEGSRITISAKMNRKSSSNRYDNWYSVDDETKSFFPEIIIQNDELDAFKNNTVRIVIIADDKRHEEQKLIVSATTMKADFPDRGKVVLDECKAGEMYDESINRKQNSSPSSYFVQ